jgi:hypothetical protein
MWKVLYFNLNIISFTEKKRRVVKGKDFQGTGEMYMPSFPPPSHLPTWKNMKKMNYAHHSIICMVVKG